MRSTSSFRASRGTRNFSKGREFRVRDAEFVPDTITARLPRFRRALRMALNAPTTKY